MWGAARGRAPAPPPHAAGAPPPPPPLPFARSASDAAATGAAAAPPQPHPPQLLRPPHPPVDLGGAREPDLWPPMGGLPAWPPPGLPGELVRVTQYLPPRLLPLLGAPLGSPAVAALLLPTTYVVDELGRSEWFLASRARLLADPVASAGYRVNHPVRGLRRPPHLTPDVLVAGPGAEGASAPPPPGSGAGAHRRVVDTARVRLLSQRRARRMRNVVLPPSNWEFVRALEERVRLVECALTDDVPLLHPVSPADVPDYVGTVPARPLCLSDLHKAVSRGTAGACAWRGGVGGGAGRGGAGGAVRASHSSH